jgi:glycosyltransferase 2 family protein
MTLFSRKALTAIIKLAISVAALVFVFTKIDISEVGRIFGHSNLLLMILALVLFVFSKYVSAIRLNLFFKSVGLDLSSIYNLKLYLLGMYYNLFLPGGIGGDGYKIWLLNRNYKVPAKKIFWAVLLDRLTGMMALFCLAVLLAMFIRADLGFPYKYYIWILIPLSVGVFYAVIRYFFNEFAPNYAVTSLQAFAVQAFQVLCAWAIFVAIGGTEKTTEYLFLFLISSIIATLPITIGGVGSREISFLYGAKLLGLDPNLSIALSLAFYIITAFTSFWGILYSIKTEGE